MKKFTVELSRKCINTQSKQIEVAAVNQTQATAKAFAILSEADDFWDGVREEPADTEQAQVTFIEEIK